MAKNVALEAYKAGEKAKKKASFRRGRGKISLAVVGGFIPLAGNMLSDAQIYSAADHGGWPVVMKLWGWRLTGYSAIDGKMHWRDLANSYVPVAAGVLIHKVANRFGVNRMLARFNLPVNI